jgi:hypothetical protein
MIAQNSIADAVAAAKRETESAQAHRLLDYLVVNEVGLTHEIARDCAIANISGAANRIRPTLHQYGVAIVATLPKPKIENRFGEPSMSHEWRLVRVR